VTVFVTSAVVTGSRHP